MADLRRMLNDADEPVTIDSFSVPLGARVRINNGKLKGLAGFVLEALSSSSGSTCSDVPKYGSLPICWT